MLINLINPTGLVGIRCMAWVMGVMKVCAPHCSTPKKILALLIVNDIGMFRGTI